MVVAATGGSGLVVTGQIFSFALKSGATCAVINGVTYRVVKGGNFKDFKREVCSGFAFGYEAGAVIGTVKFIKASSTVKKSGSKTIPDKARDIVKQVKAHNGAPPKGYKGGRTYKNIPLEDGAQKLPEGVKYKEYDINPYVKGQNRGTERIVIGDDGSVWYTNDHYYTFTQIE